MMAITSKIYEALKLKILNNKFEMTIFGFLIIKLFKYYFKMSHENEIYMILRLVTEVFLLIFISWISGKIIKDSDEKARNIAIVFFVLFFAGYVSNSVLLLDVWFNGFDVYKNFVAVFCAVIIFGIIEKPKSKWLLPLICFVCIALQPLFMFSYMPMVLILLLFKIKTGGKAAEYKDLLASTLIAAALSFLFFGLKNTFAASAEIKNQLTSNLTQLALCLTIVLPLFVIFEILWASVIKNSNNKTFRGIILLVAFEPAIAAFSLILKDSYMNLVMSAAFVQLCFIFYFLYTKNNDFTHAFEKMGRFFSKNLLLLLLSIVYLSSFSSFAKDILAGLTQAKDWQGLWH